MMAVGKTTIGKMLAKELKLEFVDTDKGIEKANSMTIEKIFRIKGEIFFRIEEKKAVLKSLKKQNCVIALGGGAFMDKDLRENILKNSISVWLDDDIKTLNERAKRNQKRPLLKNEDGGKKISELVRAAIYELNPDGESFYFDFSVCSDSTGRKFKDFWRIATIEPPENIQNYKDIVQQVVENSEESRNYFDRFIWCLLDNVNIHPELTVLTKLYVLRMLILAFTTGALYTDTKEKRRCHEITDFGKILEIVKLVKIGEKKLKVLEKKTDKVLRTYSNDI